ncbi:PREDICTED: transcription factor bHLH57 isoform X2 [Nelumbo nucifera]|uniref:Transcription factor bHLH57 isoform X2 n=1 Tax=Nelumbo nucifera TaxID=4432 RepID=A0A1U7YMH6_NELNU|nr:PREDICTED: transcription factor bHLH57 isoform X2 [Nelumbo nucifera]
MEELQEPINPCLLGVGEHLNAELLEQGVDALHITCGPSSISLENLRLEQERQTLAMPRLELKMPFLQMLQDVETPSFAESSFQLLLRLQQQQRQKPWERNNWIEMESHVQTLEQESCITYDLSEAHSPVKSETKAPHHPQSSSCLEVVVSSACNGEHNSPEKCRGGNSSCPRFTKPATAVTRERRKRKREKQSKNKEEVENQRMAHIAVERNRRKQMNDHLSALKSFMPSSFIQRELEQLLQSLQAQKRMKKSEEEDDDVNDKTGRRERESSLPWSTHWEERGKSKEELREENKSTVADIEVVVMEAHVNLKILSPRRPGQLLKTIAALEDLRLAILHLSIHSSQGSVLYSFNLKMEDDCKLGSADEIATAVHQVFNLINDH